MPFTYLNIKLTEILGVLGFILALATFIITRIERRKKLSIDLYCLSLEELDKNNEYGIDDSRLREERIIVVDIINQGPKSVAIDKNSIIITLNKIEIQHGLDWFGKQNFKNPINPGQNHRFGVFIDSAVGMTGITNRHSGIHKIYAEFKDIDNKKYRSDKNFELILEVDEIERK